MSEPIKITATVAAWFTMPESAYSRAEFQRHLESGDGVGAVGALKFYDVPGGTQAPSGWACVGEADITLRIIPNDEITRKAVGVTRAYTVSAWQRDFARAFAASVPLEAMPTQARGALLASSNDEPEDLICIGCNGSGEGQYEGTRCTSCGGSGTERCERDEPDWDALRKDRIERDLIERGA